MAQYESELMEGFKRGHRDSFKAICDELMHKLLRYLVNTYKIPDVDAEDVVADILYKLFLNRDEMKNIEHITRWCYVVAKNAAIDRLRYKIKERQHINNILFFELGVHEDSAKAELELILQSTLLAEAIHNLPRQRKAVIIAILQGKETHVIAEDLHINSQTVLNHKSKAIEELKYVLSPYKREFLQM